MQIHKTRIPGLVLMEPKVFWDERGYFLESWNKTTWQKAGINVDFVQDNQSMSMKGALRGLHFQTPPHAQDKLVRVIQGRVLDVVVDLRKGSPTYGHWESVELSSKNHLQLFIPVGFAHGFLTLEDHTIFAYKCSEFYHPETDAGIVWNDPDLDIVWGLVEYGITSPVLSAKDAALPVLKDFTSPF